MSVLSFNGRVNIAVRIVKEKYPKARLFEADGVASEGPTIDPLKIDQLRVVFDNEGQTVIIKETGYGEFGEPELFNQPWIEDIVIEWPVNMDLDQASKLKEEAGYTNGYYTVTLRNPLGPKLGNPYFIFDDINSKSDCACTKRYVFVDTGTGEVHLGQ